MGYKIGIVPAGGHAKRFRGVMKEALPLPDWRTLLEHAIERVEFCERIVIVTNEDKYTFHKRLISAYRDRRIELMLQTGDGLWGAVKTAYTAYNGDQYYLTMPDTWMTEDAFGGVPDIPFGYGYSLTDEPERFGVLIEGRFVDKPTSCRKPAVAWAVLTWNKDVRDYWLREDFEDYTEAINGAMANFRHGHWPIGRYYDCADVERYLELLNYLKAER